MGKITIRWRSYPNCPEATEYDRSRSYLETFLGFFVNLSLLSFFALFVSLIGVYWTDASWAAFFGAVICLLLGGALAHLLYVLYPYFTERRLELILLKYRARGWHEATRKYEEKRIKESALHELKETTKKYYFYYLSVVLFIWVGCILIFSIIQLAKGYDGIGMLLFSVCALIGLILGFRAVKSKYFNTKKRIEDIANTRSKKTQATKTSTTSTHGGSFCIRDEDGTMWNLSYVNDSARSAPIGAHDVHGKDFIVKPVDADTEDA